LRFQKAAGGWVGEWLSGWVIEQEDIEQGGFGGEKDVPGRLGEIKVRSGGLGSSHGLRGGLRRRNSEGNFKGHDAK
jgi:hypothetical protein